MGDWPLVRLGDVADDVTVGHVGPMVDEYRVSGLPFLRSQNVQPHTLELSDVKYIDRDFHARLSKSSLHPGDVVIVRTGKPGTAAVIPEWLPEANCADLVIVRPGPRIDARWLSYYINAAAGHYISTRLVGAVQQHFNVGAARALEFELPPKDEQRRQAAILCTLDDKIAAHAAWLKRTEDLLRAEFDLLAMDNALESPVARSVRVNAIFSLNPAERRVTSGQPVYLDMQRLPAGSFAVESWTRRPASGGVRFMNGDTLMARITPCLENGKTGYVDFLEDGEVGIGSTEYIVIRSREDRGVPLPVSYFLATSPRFHAYAVQQMVGSSGRQRVSAADLADYPLVMPDPGHLEAFGAKAAPLFALARARVRENAALAELRDTLLPALMSGRLRIRDAERAIEAVV